MAEAIGIAAGTLALATFAFNSSVSLYQTVKSFQSNKREIRELKEELEALSNVIQSLQQLASRSETQFEALRLPLLRCGKTCRDFEEVIANCTKHSNESKTSFRDWAKLQYMGNDISGFKNMLAGYKSTISIAIGDVNLRTATVGATAIQEFKEMLANTKNDLEEHLEGLDDKLEALSMQENSTKDAEMPEKGWIWEEIGSLKDCLAVCNNAEKHVDAVRTNVFDDISAAEDAHQLIVSTFGELVSAKQVRAGVGATQWLGQMSDTSLQQLALSRGVDLSSRSGVVKSVEEQSKARPVWSWT